MIIIISYTEQEQQALNAIEEKYRPALEKVMQELNKLDISKNFDEYINASNKFNEINEKIMAEREVYYKQAENRTFNSFNGDIVEIVEAVKNQILTFIYISKALAGEAPTQEERAENEKYIAKNREKLLKGIEHNEKLLKQFPDDQELIKNTAELREVRPEVTLRLHYDNLYSEEALHERIEDSFKLYLDFLSQCDPTEYKNLQQYIDKAIKNRDNIVLEREEAVKNISADNSIIQISTKYPTQYITPIDKISNKMLIGEIEGAKMNELAMEKRGSKKEITNIVSIDYEELNGSIQIKGRRELTPYDREVHDAIVTLFVDGDNEYITSQMIYQTMTGNKKAYLNPKQAEAISESITKCIYSRVTINAEEEAKAFGFESLKYDGTLIQGERATATLNGEVTECLRILRQPILYEYASRKNQIGRFDIKYLNSPINKTEEILAMQGYLHRRILSMKGSNLSKTIVYETVYKYINVEAATPGALRKKKAKIRSQIKVILDYWKQEKFITGYVENKRRAEIYSVTIRL